jgi:hypothetical protein
VAALVAEALRLQPLRTEVLPAIPGGLTLLCLVLAAAVRARADEPARSTVGTFFKLLLLFLLAWFPGVGLLVGLVVSLIWLFKHRRGTMALSPVLLVSTLAWQGSLTLYFWSVIVSYLPFLAR